MIMDRFLRLMLCYFILNTEVYRHLSRLIFKLFPYRMAIDTLRYSTLGRRPEVPKELSALACSPRIVVN